VTKDRRVGLGALEKACKLGHAISCGELGGFYYDGIEIPKNIVKAMALFKIGCLAYDDTLSCLGGGLIQAAEGSALRISRSTNVLEQSLPA